MKSTSRLTLQFALGCVVTIAGVVLLFISLFVPPKGEIHSSLLVAFGEVSTFAGALIGVDYHYRYKEFINHPGDENLNR